MKYFLLAASLLIAANCHAVVSIESSIRTSDNATVSSTASPVNVAAANDLLVVFIAAFDNVTFADTAISAVTYNAVGMTQLTNTEHSASNRRVYTYYMLNPPTGANTLSVTWAGAPIGGHVHAVVLTGNNTTAPIDASSGTALSAQTTFTVSTATVNNGAITLSFCSTSANILTGQGSGQTNLLKASNNFYWTSYTQPSTSGTQTHVYSNGTSDAYAMNIVSVDSQVSPSFHLDKRRRMERYE